MFMKAMNLKLFFFFIRPMHCSNPYKSAHTDYENMISMFLRKFMSTYEIAFKWCQGTPIGLGDSSVPQPVLTKMDIAIWRQ